MPSGAQKPLLIQVVPPRRTSTTAATPAAKSEFEISPARQNPKAPAMISIARGKELSTTPAHARSFSPDASAPFPEAEIEYARAVFTAMSRRSSAPSAELEAVAAAPQPSRPASASVVRIAAANHMRLSTAMPARTEPTRIQVRLPLQSAPYATRKKTREWMPLCRHSRSQKAVPYTVVDEAVPVDALIRISSRIEGGRPCSMKRAGCSDSSPIAARRVSADTNDTHSDTWPQRSGAIVTCTHQPETTEVPNDPSIAFRAGACSRIRCTTLGRQREKQ